MKMGDPRRVSAGFRFNGKNMKEELKDYLTDRLGELEGVQVNSRKGAGSAPQIVSASFDGVRSEVLLHALEDRDRKSVV